MCCLAQLCNPPDWKWTRRGPSSFVSQKVAERMLLLLRQVELPSVMMPSPLILVVTPTKPPLPPQPLALGGFPRMGLSLLGFF